MSMFSRGVLNTSTKVELGQLQKPNGKHTHGPKGSVDVHLNHYFPGGKRKYENNIKHRNPTSSKNYVFNKSGATMFSATKLFFYQTFEISLQSLQTALLMRLF